MVTKIVQWRFLSEMSLLIMSFIIMIIWSKTCDISAVLPQMFKVEVFLWHRSEISYPSLNVQLWLNIDPNWYKSPSFKHLFSVVSSSQISGVRELYLGDPQPCACQWRPHVGACCECILYLCPVSSPRVCLIPACRPCRVSHTEPNAINVSAHGAALWGRGHGWPGGPRPERPSQHPAGQPQQHVSD